MFTEHKHTRINRTVGAASRRQSTRAVNTVRGAPSARTNRTGRLERKAWALPTLLEESSTEDRPPRSSAPTTPRKSRHNGPPPLRSYCGTAPNPRPSERREPPQTRKTNKEKRKKKKKKLAWCATRSAQPRVRSATAPWVFRPKHPIFGRGVDGIAYFMLPHGHAYVGPAHPLPNQNAGPLPPAPEKECPMRACGPTRQPPDEDGRPLT